MTLEEIAAVMAGADPVGVDELLGRPSWQRQGACRSSPTDVFFPGKGQSLEPARAICRRCEVVQPCMAYALAQDDLEGVWAATSKQQRAEIRRGHADAA